MAAGPVWGWWGETGVHAWVALGRACGVLKFAGVRLRGGLARLRPAPPGTNGDCPLLPGAILRSALGVLRSTPGGTNLGRPLRLKGQQNGEETRVNGAMEAEYRLQAGRGCLQATSPSCEVTKSEI